MQRCAIPEGSSPRKHRTSGLLFALATLLTACQSDGVGYEVQLPLATQYVFRGAVVNKDPVFQPSVSAHAERGNHALDAVIWSNYDSSDDNGKAHDWTEVDYSGGYTHSEGTVSTSVGFIHYAYPSTQFESSSEVYAMASTAWNALTSTLEVWYDYEVIDGYYVNLNVSRDWDLHEAWGLATKLGIGYMDKAQGEYFFGPRESGWADLLAQATLTRPISERGSFFVSWAFSEVLDASYRNAQEDSNHFWVSVGTSWTF
ncbi:MAG TPA: hypothetical protein PLJ12_13305 [Planctomycetota bacterium]|nr:hypothetical protein [Planctomycetota bacterium]